MESACSENERKSNLNISLRAILPILQNVNITALIEPLGFMRSSLRSKSDVINAIKSINGENQFKLVHDTFHHALAGGDLFPDSTGLVHISAVNEVDLKLVSNGRYASSYYRRARSVREFRSVKKSKKRRLCWYGFLMSAFHHLFIQ